MAGVKDDSADCTPLRDASLWYISTSLGCATVMAYDAGAETSVGWNGGAPVARPKMDDALLAGACATLSAACKVSLGVPPEPAVSLNRLEHGVERDDAELMQAASELARELMVVCGTMPFPVETVSA